MSVSAAGNPVFYRVGGTIPLDAPSYMVRKADQDLFSALLAGEYCYVLDSRQIGKSSLMLRTAVQLRKEGVAALILDLTALGQNVTPEQWYFGLLGQMARGLLQFDIDLEDQFDALWDEHPELGPLQRWTAAIENIVLKEWTGKIVLFIDEIDCVRSLRFSTDEFFAGIRELYNRRSRKPDLNRIAFCLLGVASPSDLVKDPHTTPFNIGRRIELTDFTEEEAVPLAAGLGRDEPLARKLLARVLYWTAGHPYLTQVLCRAISDDLNVSDPQGVDRHCEEHFLSARAREKDDNLLFVSRQMLACPDLPGVLTLYDKIRRGRRPVLDDETDSLINHLRLAGIVRARQGVLHVRNRIYGQVFDHRWVISRMPDAELRRQREAYKRGMIKAGAIAAAVVLLILAGNVTYLYLFVWEHVTYAKSWNKRYGKHEEDGLLTREQARHRAVSYRFVRYGRLNPILLIQAVNSEGKLTTEHGTSTYFGDSGKSNDSDKVCQWQVVYDLDGRVVYERALDREGRMVWGFVYSPSAAAAQAETHGFFTSLLGRFNPALKTVGSPPSEAKGHYVGPDGYSKPDASTGAEYVQFFYDKNGFEGLILYRDRLGNPKQGLDRAFGKLNSRNSKGQNLYQISIDAAGRPMTDDSGNCGALSYYDANGNLTFLASFDTEGNLVDWKDRGFAGRAYGRDRSGNNVSLSYYNADGSPGLSEDGFHRVEKSLDDRGNVVEYRYFGTNQEPVLLKEGHHIWRGSYDKAGNLVDFAYFDAASLPTTINAGYHKAVCTYDQRGRQTAIAYFDVSGNKTLHKDGQHIAATQFDDTPDNDGHTRNRWCYYDVDGRPVDYSPSGAHMTRSVFDTNGHIVESAYFDRERKPTLSRHGYHKVKQTFDIVGNRIERRFLGIDERPAVSADGVSSEVAAYNENGNQISIAYYDKDGKPSTTKDTGVHRIVRSFDAMGRRTHESYFGPDGNATLNEMRVHSKSSRHDIQGNETQISFSGVKGEPVSCADGYHRRKNTFDKWRRLIGQEYFNTTGRACADSSSLAHRVSYGHDSRGRRVKVSFFGEKDQPVLSKEQHHLRRIEYDERGNVIGVRLFGLKAEPVAPVEIGWHYKKATFDSKNRQLTESYYGTRDEPVSRPRTIHRVAFTNDNLGRQVAAAFFGTDGSPGTRTDGTHKVTQDHDGMGRVVRESYFDSSNNPLTVPDGFQSLAYRRDALGNIAEKAYFGAEGKPATVMPDGRVHRVMLKYDDGGHVVEEAYFGPDGNPVPGSTGVHKIVRNFNGHGNMTEVSFFDTRGEPASVLGRHRIATVYGRGEFVSESYFDAGGQPVVRNGISGRRRKSDAIEMLDQDGNPTSTLGVITVSALPIPGGPGEAAGVRVGDIILVYDNWRFPIDREVVDWNQEANGLRAATSAPGETPRRLVVLRDGRLIDQMVAPGLLQVRLMSEPSSRNWLRTAAQELNR